MSAKTVSNQTGLFPSDFNDFFKPGNAWIEAPAGDIWTNILRVPALNVMENNEDFKITMAIPGVERQHLHIVVEGNMLTVSADERLEKENKEGKYTRKEYNYSTFSRSVALPEGILMDKIVAGYENGELTLTLPKSETIKQTTARHIAVQ
jgi:HSP20 family protein